MSPKEFINRAADACLEEQLSTIKHEHLRENWGRIIRKYMWAIWDQKGQPTLDPYTIPEPPAKSL